MNGNTRRSRKLPTLFRQRRLALGLRALDVAQGADFSISKIYRIEKAPERARLGDVRAVEETLQRLEREAAGAPNFPAELSAAVEPKP